MKGITKFCTCMFRICGWLRAAVLYALSLIAIRLVGKRTIGQLSFDLLAIVILCSGGLMEDNFPPRSYTSDDYSDQLANFESTAQPAD